MSHGVTSSIFEQFVIAVRDAYAADSLAPTIANAAWKAGRLESMGQAAAPSIRWRRTSGTIEAASRLGPHSYIPDGETVPVFYTSRFQDVATVEARITATSWDQLDDIWGRLLTASWESLGTQSRPGGYDHVTESDDDEPEAQKGNQILIQTFEWRLPIPHDVHGSGQVATIETVAGTSQFHNTNPAPPARRLRKQTRSGERMSSNKPTQVPPAPPEESPPSAPSKSDEKKGLPTVSEHAALRFPYAKKGRVVDGERRPHADRWKHSAAAALHCWAEAAHHLGAEVTLSDEDYSKAIDAACEPKNGRYAPHAPALFDLKKVKG